MLPISIYIIEKRTSLHFLYILYVPQYKPIGVIYIILTNFQNTLKSR